MKPPRVTNCIICEDIRSESSGKGMILGFFGILPEVSIFIPDEGAVGVRVVLVFLTTAPEQDGKLPARVILKSPDGRIVDALPFDLEFIRGRRLIFSAEFPALEVKRRFGRYEVLLHIGEVSAYTSSFEVLPGSEKPWDKS